MRRLVRAGLAGLLLLPLGCDQPSSPDPDGPAPVYGFEVEEAFLHDRFAFTQGLAYEDGFLWEGTGRHGESGVRKVDLRTGAVLEAASLGSEYFGEGIALRDGQVVQLTWKARTGFVWDAVTLEPEGTITYPTEGWGLTWDGTRFVMSDGTATLYFRDPATFEEIGHVEVRDDVGPVERLNELEWVRGEVWANVWKTDRIARIDPSTGRVTGWIDLTGLLPDSVRTGDEDVLNGIAWDRARDRVFVTGKLWPRLYQIRLVPR